VKDDYRSDERHHYSATPVHLGGNCSVSDSEKAEALADSLEAHLQPDNDRWTPSEFRKPSEVSGSARHQNRTVFQIRL
jgi:hypothetical protein